MTLSVHTLRLRTMAYDGFLNSTVATRVYRYDTGMTSNLRLELLYLCPKFFVWADN